MSRRGQRGGPPIPSQRPSHGAWQQQLAQAVKLHQAGNLDAAAAGYRDVLRSSINQPDALHLLGVVAIQRGQPAEAVPLIERALASRGNSAAYLGSLGVALQALGRAPEARRALERGASLEPRNVDVLFNLGITLQHLGEHEAAVDRYQAVLKLAPAHGQARFNLGNALQAVGRYDEAVACYRQVSALVPPSPTLLSSLGTALMGSGQTDEALSCFDQAATLAPSDPVVLSNLALALHQHRRYDEAVTAYERVLALPSLGGQEQARTLRNLAQSLQAAGRPDQALTTLEVAHRSAPDDVDLLFDLARTLRLLGRSGEALAPARRASALAPDNANVIRLLGSVLRDLGRYDEVAGLIQRMLEIDPTLVEARQDLASLLMDLGQVDEALPMLRQIVEARPDVPSAWANLGFALEQWGDPRGAVEAFDRAVAIEPWPALALRRATVLPIVSGSHDDMLAWRARWVREVEQVRAAGLSVDDPLQLLRPSFYLAYQGLDDRACQEQLARLYLDVCPQLGWVAPRCRAGARPDRGERIRVGIISRFLSQHTIGKLMQGIVARLNRRRFEVVVLQLGQADAAAQRIAALADKAIWLTGNLTQLQQQIAATELDVLFYADVGMDPTTYFLAYARLAPIQCVTWGHPVTTGIPNVDAFLSAEVLEPPGAEMHYRERLVRLGRLPTWYERPIVPDRPIDRAGLGLPENATLYVCPQSLFKLHPDFDEAVAEILRRDPRGRVVLIDGMSKHWSRLILERLSGVAPDVVGRVLVLPRMSGDRFFDLIRAADVLLDPFHFGGGNTTYEAFAVGTPIVTWPGPFMRGRVTLGAYRQMGVDGPIAATPMEYVRLAVELANDRAARERLGEQIRAASGALYEDDLAIAEIEAYVERAVAEARATEPALATLGR